jgi:hypothetical protein
MVVVEGHQGRSQIRTLPAAAHNPAVLKHIKLNLIRLGPVKRKGGIKARRLIVATSGLYSAQLLGLR